MRRIHKTRFGVLDEGQYSFMNRKSITETQNQVALKGSDNFFFLNPGETVRAPSRAEKQAYRDQIPHISLDEAKHVSDWVECEYFLTHPDTFNTGWYCESPRRFRSEDIPSSSEDSFSDEEEVVPEEIRSRTLELALQQYEDDKMAASKPWLMDLPNENHKPARGVISPVMRSSCYTSLESPYIPFVREETPDDYSNVLVKLYDRYTMITPRNVMAYVACCHRAVSDLVRCGYFNVNQATYTQVIPRCLQAIRRTGIVPEVRTMLRDNYATWIQKHELEKGNMVGQFIWQYMFHFSILYDDKFKRHKRFVHTARTLIKLRIDVAQGHMLQGMLNEAIEGIPEETYENVATKLLKAFRSKLAESFTVNIPEAYKKAGIAFASVIGGLLATSLLLYSIRIILGESHSFVVFMKNLIYPYLSKKQWAESAPVDDEKQAEGHMWENIQPIVVRFGIMLIQVVCNTPTSAREVGECLRNISFGASFVETILNNVEPLFRLLAYKITGDKMWTFQDMDDDINAHLCAVEELRGVANLHMRVGNDKSLRMKVEKEYKWHHANVTSLRSAGMRDKSLAPTIGRAERDLNSWYESTVNANLMASSRVVPICIMLSGAVNQGKTSMISMVIKIVHAFFKKHDQYTHDLHTYFSKAKDSEYWDGYQHQITYIVDEFLASSQAVVRDAQVMELLGVVNGGVYPLNFADCKSKGTDVFDSPLVIYTTNYNKWSEIQMTDPGALFRRIHFPLELKRGDTIKNAEDIDTAWYVTVTDHAFANRNLYAGTSQAFWNAAVVPSRTGLDERRWMPFKEFMEIVLDEYAQRLAAKPLTDHMGEADDYCKNSYPNHFLDSTESSVSSSLELLTEDSSDELTSGDGLVIFSCADDSEEDSTSDVSKLLLSSADGHMMNFFGFFGNHDDGWSTSSSSSDSDGKSEDSSSESYEPPEFDAEGSCANVEQFYKGLSDEVSFDRALAIVCQRLAFDQYRMEGLFETVWASALGVVNSSFGTGHVLPMAYRRPFANTIAAHTVFYHVVERVSRLRVEWRAMLRPLLLGVANSLDGLLLPKMYPDQFDSMFHEYFVEKNNCGIILSQTGLLFCVKRFHEVAHWEGVNTLLWNVGSLKSGERRIQEYDDDACMVLGHSHVCGSFYENRTSGVRNVYRRVNDFLGVMRTVVTHMYSTASQYASVVFTDLQTAIFPLYQFFVQNASLMSLYLISFASGLALIGLAVGIQQLVEKLTRKHARAHSETHKNPVFVRKGRALDKRVPYAASGHMHTHEALNAAVTTRNSITRHFVIQFEDGEEVKGKCVALGRYVFFHSHVLWAFGAIRNIALCNDPHGQLGGSTCFTPKDFVLYDFMNDHENKRDLVRLEFKGTSYLGKKPETYLVPRAVWSKELEDNALVRVLGAGENRKFSLPHIVPDVFRIGRAYGTRIVCDGEEIIKYHDAGYMAYDTPSLPGDCSDPYVAGNKLMGLHVAFANGDSVFMPIYLEDCRDDIGIGAMSYTPRVVSHDLRMPGGVTPIGMVGRDYTGRAVNPYVPSIYGARGEPGVGGYLPPIFPLGRVPSPLKGLNGLSPWSKHNLNYTRTYSPAVPNAYLQKTRRDPGCFVRDFFKVPGRHRSHRLSDTEVDNGIPGYLVGVDVSTSAGLLGKVHGKKREELYERDDQGLLIPGEELRQAAAEIHHMVENNTVPMVMCCENLKAETIPPDKLPRCFTGVSIEHLRWTKAVVGDALAYMKKHVVGSGCAVGINPHSIQWEKLYTEFVDGFGDDGFIIAGDLSNCDLSCHPAFVDALFALLNDFYKYQEETFEYKELYFCCLSIVNQVRLRGKRLFELYRGHPSGHYMTTLFNCVVVFCIHRFAYEQLVDTVKYPWAENVRLKVYGDDSLGCVHRRVSEWYNMQTIQKFFSEFGMIYTAADKSTDIPKFIDRNEANFLGRGFRMERNVMCAPLSKDAIYGMIHWVRTENVTIDEALDANIKCALMEMYHHGEKEFVDFKNKLYYEGNRRGHISPVLTGNITYSFLREWHLKAYHGCDDCYTFGSVDDLTDMFFQ